VAPVVTGTDYCLVHRCSAFYGPFRRTMAALRALSCLRHGPDAPASMVLIRGNLVCRRLRSRSTRSDFEPKAASAEACRRTASRLRLDYTIPRTAAYALSRAGARHAGNCGGFLRHTTSLFARYDANRCLRSVGYRDSTGASEPSRLISSGALTNWIIRRTPLALFLRLRSGRGTR